MTEWPHYPGLCWSRHPPPLQYMAGNKGSVIKCDISTHSIFGKRSRLRPHKETCAGFVHFAKLGLKIAGIAAAPIFWVQSLGSWYWNFSRIETKHYCSDQTTTMDPYSLPFHRLTNMDSNHWKLLKNHRMQWLPDQKPLTPMVGEAFEKPS